MTISRWFVLAVLIFATGCRDQSAKLSPAVDNVAPSNSDALASKRDASTTVPGNVGAAVANESPSESIKDGPTKVPKMETQPRTVIPPRTTVDSGRGQTPTAGTAPRRNADEGDHK